jgi:hypothetical protein
LNVTGSINSTTELNISASRYNYGSILTVSGSANVVHTTVTGSFRSAFYNYVAFSGSTQERVKFPTFGSELLRLTLRQ